jgi:hypothetical protein
MARVAIIGSCITRDLWPVRGDEHEGLLYISRTSLPSLFAAPAPGFRAAARRPAGLGPFQHRALVADIRKTALDRLVAFRPTHLIFDFIDERFDLLAGCGSLITRSWELEASGYRRSKALRDWRVIPRLSAPCERLWREAAVQMGEFVRGTPLRSARLVLHSARWAKTSRGSDGVERPIAGAEVLPGEPADIEAHNELLATYELAFTAAMPPVETVAAPQLRVADENHQWGLSPFHFTPEYGEAIWRQLETLGVPRPSGRSDGPSARAA